MVDSIWPSPRRPHPMREACLSTGSDSSKRQRHHYFFISQLGIIKGGRARLAIEQTGNSWTARKSYMLLNLLARQYSG